MTGKLTDWLTDQRGDVHTNGLTPAEDWLLLTSREANWRFIWHTDMRFSPWLKKTMTAQAGWLVCCVCARLRLLPWAKQSSLPFQLSAEWKGSRNSQAYWVLTDKQKPALVDGARTDQVTTGLQMTTIYTPPSTTHHFSTHYVFSHPVHVILYTRGPQTFVCEGQIIFLSLMWGRVGTENYLGRSNYQYYCGDFIMILNVFISTVKR